MKFDITPLWCWAMTLAVVALLVDAACRLPIANL